MPDESPNADPSLEEQLVAYLDGELDPKASQRIEELLANDPQVRQTLQQLDRTWDLLDELDQPPIGDRFTQTTLEMVAVAATEDAQRAQAAIPRRRLRRLFIVAGSLLAAGLAGFLTTAMVRSAPNRQLVRDLPILENLDNYRLVDSIEFLRMLDKEGLFAEENGDEHLLPLTCLATAEPARADDAESARQRIENMNPAEKETLRRQLESFEKLDPAQQERLRQLHKDLQQDPKSEQLRRVMQGYCKWLKELSPYRRAELLEIEPVERIQRIKQICEEEAKRPTREDMEGVFRWMEQFVSKHGTGIQESLPEPLKKKMAELDSDRRRRWLAWMGWQQWQMSRFAKPLRATDDDLAALRNNLTENARKHLESEPPERQWQIVSGWIRSSFRHRISSRQFGGPTPPDLQKELNRFFEEELSREEQDRLLNLPGDEMERELRRRYVMRMRSDDPSHGRPHHSGRGGPPGPPGGDRSRSMPPRRGPRGGPPPESSSPEMPRRGPPRSGFPDR